MILKRYGFTIELSWSSKSGKGEQLPLREITNIKPIAIISLILPDILLNLIP